MEPRRDRRARWGAVEQELRAAVNPAAAPPRPTDPTSDPTSDPTHAPDGPTAAGPPTAAPRRRTLPQARPLPFVLAAIAGLAMRPSTDPDLWWHLATGRWILGERRIPFTDPFSWTVPGRAWIAHEWLTEIAFELIHRVGGFGALVALSIALITASSAVAARSARSMGAADGVTAALLLVGAFASAHTWGPRPQVITLLLFAATVARLRRFSRELHPSTPWLLVPLTVVWSNLHGGFMFGLTAVWAFALALTAEAVIGRFAPPRLALLARGWRPVRTRRELTALWGVAGACVVAAMATPNHWRGLVYPFSYLGDNASTRYVGEWVRPWMAWRWAPFFAIAAVTAAGLVRRWRRVGLLEAGLLGFFGLLAFTSVRNIPSFVVVAVPFAASALSRTQAERDAAEARLERALDARDLRLTLAGRPVPQRRPRPAPAAGPRTGAVASTHSRWRRLAGRMRPEALVIAAVLAVVNSHAFTTAGTIDANRRLQPMATLEAFQRDPGTGRLLNHYNFGGWLIWKGVPVFTDGRPDMYGDAFVDRYWLLNSATGDWRGELARWRVDRVLFPPDSPLVGELRRDGWRTLATDPAAVLLAPPDGAGDR